ncbi:MAG TPA: hypothetical protein VGD11_07385 [Mycobacteriales bacterium]
MNLSDLDTGAPYVRGRLTADLAAVFGATARRGYVYQEVFSHPGDVVPTSAYTGVGDVTEFSYGETVSSAFRSGNLACSRSPTRTGPRW